MSRFDVLTKYTTMFQLDIIGEWVIDKKGWNTGAYNTDGFCELLRNDS